MAPRAKPFTESRRWQMGVVLGALELGLDLDKAEVDLPRGRIVLRSPGGLERVIPVDREGSFYIDWSLPPNHSALKQEAALSLLQTHAARLNTNFAGAPPGWSGKLVVVGSSALGNDLTDRGATPLRSDTLLASKHWNVASSIITGRFVQRAPLSVEIALILLLGMFSALVTWRMRAVSAFVVVLLSSAAFVAASFAIYWQFRYWLPLVLPVMGGLLVSHLCLLTWRVVFEQAERRRVRSVFSKVVSRKIVDELLATGNLALGGARREITVFFADVRGFTEFTDAGHERVLRQIRERGLQGADAEALIDAQARETLATVNLYLGLIADIVIRRDGTLDKFIGDCVMAFWGAPAGNATHAVSCVRAAIEAQRAIHLLNEQRARTNASREQANEDRVKAGLDPQPLLPLLELGSGINTGVATVGLMGSAAEIRSYTVFGRDVNLASRLEAVSGRGRVIISESTYQHLLRDDPALAETCVSLEPVTVKGIRQPVPIFEVPWK
jgi:adenylate cyclase